MTDTRVTRKEAEQVLELLKGTYKSYISAGYMPPTLEENWNGSPWVILWEEGPFEWAIFAFTEHVEEEMYNLAREAGASREEARKIATRPEVQLPEGIWVESITRYSIAVLREY